MQVQHDTAARRFTLPLEGAEAVFQYELAPGTLIATHTEVPAALRGRGLAEILTRAALDWARREKRRVVPQCSYVARFLEKHPEYRDGPT